MNYKYRTEEGIIDLESIKDSEEYKRYLNAEKIESHFHKLYEDSIEMDILKFEFLEQHYDGGKWATDDRHMYNMGAMYFEDERNTRFQDCIDLLNKN